MKNSIDPFLLPLVMSVIITIGLIILVIIWIRFLVSQRLLRTEARIKERLLILEKTANPTLLQNGNSKKDLSPLLWGCLLAGMGFGEFAGYIIHLITNWNDYVITNAMVFFFGGLALIGYHAYARRAEQKKHS
jgi:hypothetical protein